MSAIDLAVWQAAWRADVRRAEIATRATVIAEAAAAIRAAGPATLRILPKGHTGEVVLVDLAEAYAALVEGLGG